MIVESYISNHCTMKASSFWNRYTKYEFLSDQRHSLGFQWHVPRILQQDQIWSGKTYFRLQMRRKILQLPVPRLLKATKQSIYFVGDIVLIIRTGYFQVHRWSPVVGISGENVRLRVTFIYKYPRGMFLKKRRIVFLHGRKVARLSSRNRTEWGASYY